MNPIPFGQRIFSESMRAYQSHRPNHGSSSQIPIISINYWVLKWCLTFTFQRETRNKKQVYAHVFQETWSFWLWATYHDPKDLLRGIINWNLFQWMLFPVISLQKQKKIIGQGIHKVARVYWWMKLERLDTRSEMVNIQKFLQRNSNSILLIPPCLFDLQWCSDCRSGTKPSSVQGPGDFVLEKDSSRTRKSQNNSSKGNNWDETQISQTKNNNSNNNENLEKCEQVQNSLGKFKAIRLQTCGQCLLWQMHLY